MLLVPEDYSPKKSNKFIFAHLELILIKEELCTRLFIFIMLMIIMELVTNQFY